jgi:hypothetical protein
MSDYYLQSCRVARVKFRKAPYFGLQRSNIRAPRALSNHDALWRIADIATPKYLGEYVAMPRIATPMRRHIRSNT